MLAWNNVAASTGCAPSYHRAIQNFSTLRYFIIDLQFCRSRRRAYLQRKIVSIHLIGHQLVEDLSDDGVETRGAVADGGDLLGARARRHARVHRVHRAHRVLRALRLVCGLSGTRALPMRAPRPLTFAKTSSSSTRHSHKPNDCQQEHSTFLLMQVSGMEILEKYSVSIELTSHK